MEKIFEMLKSTKKVEAPDYLYDEILKKVEQRKNSTIGIFWFSAAAAVLVCMISVEVLLIRESMIEKEKITLKSVIPTNNNILYNE